MNFLRTSQVTEAEFWSAYRRVGGIYFIRDSAADMIKVGHSRDIDKRLSNLQVGSANRLYLIGLVAADIAIEPIIHQWLIEGHSKGEWFWDRGVTHQWLMTMTRGLPLHRNVWELVPGQQFISVWHEETKSHTKHLLNDKTGKWEPPLK